MARHNNLCFEKALDAIEEYIDVHGLKENDALPAERKLAEELMMSRGTVREALKALECEGKIYKIHGKGNFVEAERHSVDINDMQSFSAAEKREGNIPSSKVIFFQMMKAGEMVAEKLNISSEDKVYSLCRIRKINGKPVMIETAYLPAVIVPGLERYDFEEESLYHILERDYKIEIMNQELNIQLSRASDQEAARLEIEPGDLVYVEKAAARTVDNRIVEYTKSIISSKRAKYRIRLSRREDILMLDELKLSILCNEEKLKRQEGYAIDSIEAMYWEHVDQALAQVKRNNSKICFYLVDDVMELMMRYISNYADFLILNRMEREKAKMYVDQALERNVRVALIVEDDCITICSEEKKEQIYIGTKVIDMEEFQKKFLFGIGREWEPIKCVRYALNHL